MSLFPGNSGQQSDAPSAYTQSRLQTGSKGDYVVTWIELPKSQWPKAWEGQYERPACELRLSLYGHPMSGKYWENHYSSALLQGGFQRLPGWECTFYHEKLGLILSVYVDDFKLCGRKESLAKGWKLMTDAGLVLDPPTDLGDYLGCGQAVENLASPP